MGICRVCYCTLGSKINRSEAAGIGGGGGGGCLHGELFLRRLLSTTTGRLIRLLFIGRLRLICRRFIPAAAAAAALTAAAAPEEEQES